MGYLQALQLMVRAYKAARGVMPKGLDLLKLKMRARQKAIDSKKVIQFPKDKITPFNKPRPTKPEGIIPVTVKGKTTKMSPEGIMNMLMKKGKDVKLGQAPKTTKVKEPVDPKLVLQESEKEMAKRMMRENKEAIKRFKEKMNKPRDDKATGGLARTSFANGGNGTSSSNMDELHFLLNKSLNGVLDPAEKERLEFLIDATGYLNMASGGLANLSTTYDNNPTLQSQYPNKQDYLDMFSSTTTTTPQTQTYTQMTQQSPASTQVVKPIVPIIPQGGGDGGGGGITNIDKGLKTADDYGLGVDNQTGMGYQLTEEDLKNIDDARLMSGIKSFGYDVKQLFKNLPTAKALKSGKDFALDLIQKAKDAARARELAKLQAAARAAGFQGDTRTKEERDFSSSQTYGGGGTRSDMGADTFI